MPDTEPRFDILFVCTGNQCRSALAEVITRTLADTLPVGVTSAGTMALRPTPSPIETVQAASTLGYHLIGHMSRPLAEADAAASDLVVGFELTHVATAVVDHGVDRTKTFLLKELVDALEHAGAAAHEDIVATARSVIAAANERRASAFPGLEHQIADPIGRSARTHMETARTIDDLCRRLVTRLFPNRH
ncbi:MAG: hypothetical protein H0U17_08255 [Actinobacteria bacterium]|nr:hypothetical protein [Actinomycetota bacterium]